MKAAQLLDRGVFEVCDVPDPTLVADHVLLKVEGAGMCHSDVHLVHGDSSARLPLPLTLGHERVGLGAHQRGDGAARSVGVIVDHLK